MARIEHYDKRVGITYVYESESYYDKGKRQSRSKRKLIGKTDPETGEMVPTGKKGRPPKNITSIKGKAEYQNLYESVSKELNGKNEMIKTLKEQLSTSKATVREQKLIIQKIKSLCGDLEASYNKGGQH